jgi:hypothetical protein
LSLAQLAFKMLLIDYRALVSLAVERQSQSSILHVAIHFERKYPARKKRIRPRSRSVPVTTGIVRNSSDFAGGVVLTEES